MKTNIDELYKKQKALKEYVVDNLNRLNLNVWFFIDNGDICFRLADYTYTYRPVCRFIYNKTANNDISISIITETIPVSLDSLQKNYMPNVTYYDDFAKKYISLMTDKKRLSKIYDIIRPALIEDSIYQDIISSANMNAVAQESIKAMTSEKSEFIETEYGSYIAMDSDPDIE